MARETFDVVVVGGGVTGCGTALDAASRGLSVALVEMRDYAAGTSSRSGKLIHGGLRYLEQGKFGLVRQALTERALMLERLCPHLVRPVRFIYPLRHRAWERAYVGAGLMLYDGIGGAGAVPRHRHLGRRAAQRLAPDLGGGGLAGAVTFSDAQVDDARHTVTLARTAAAYGAVVASGAKVVDFLTEGERISGVLVRDSDTGHELPVRAHQVISATGVWNDTLSARAGATGGLRVSASKGVHVLVPRERIRSEAAILLRAEDSVLFVRPWGRHWLIGTTDTPWQQDLDHPAATGADVDYLLRNVNRAIRPRLTRDDVVGAFAGLRPLLTADAGSTSAWSREHAVTCPREGLTVVAGGKYTTYRVMAADAVDAALRNVAGTVPESCSAEVPLLGADGYQAVWNCRHRLFERSGLPVDQIERLIGRYGSLVEELLDQLAEHPEWGEPIPGAEDYLMVEAAYAATHEGAQHLDDVLCRRLHIGTETADRGVRAARHVAPVIAPVLGWDAGTTSHEIERYARRSEAERQAQLADTDEAANAVRLSARDPRL
ncbi:glycerol-3-phosphate dehydrogenase/oxidase [Haloechinothrix alba]